jgi:hypothetical protein
MDKYPPPFSVEESASLFKLAGYEREDAVDVQRNDSWILKMKLILSLKAAALKYKSEAEDLNKIASIIFEQMSRK